MKPIDGNGCRTTEGETVDFAEDIGRSTRESDSLVRVEPGRSMSLCGAFLGGHSSGDGMTGARPADMDCYHCYSKSVAHEISPLRHQPASMLFRLTRAHPTEIGQPDRLPRHPYGAFAFYTGHFGWAKAAVFPRRLSNRIFNARR